MDPKAVIPQAKPIEVKAKKYIANGVIYHEGVTYNQGDEIEVLVGLAEVWLASGTIEEIY